MSVEPVMNTIHSCSRLGWSNLHLRSIYVAYSLIVNTSTYGPVHEVVADWPWVVDASGSSLTPAAVASALVLICTQTTIPKQFRPWMSDKRLKIVLVAYACIHTYAVDASSFLFILAAVAPVRMDIHLHTDKQRYLNHAGHGWLTIVSTSLGPCACRIRSHPHICCGCINSLWSSLLILTPVASVPTAFHPYTNGDT